MMHLETELVKEQEKVSQLQLTMQAEADESQTLKKVQYMQFSFPVKSCFTTHFICLRVKIL